MIRPTTRRRFLKGAIAGLAGVAGGALSYRSAFAADPIKLGFNGDLSGFAFRPVRPRRRRRHSGGDRRPQRRGRRARAPVDVGDPRRSLAAAEIDPEHE